MDYTIVPDMNIIAVNVSKKPNCADSLLYCCKDGTIHQIDFEICAENYMLEHGDAFNKIIGERNNSENCYILYTSGIKTKIVFKKPFVHNFIKHHLLSGARASRFNQFHKLISESKYTTYDV